MVVNKTGHRILLSKTTVAELKEKIGEDRVILGLSGGRLHGCRHVITPGYR